MIYLIISFICGAIVTVVILLVAAGLWIYSLPVLTRSDINRRTRIGTSTPSVPDVRPTTAWYLNVVWVPNPQYLSCWGSGTQTNLNAQIKYAGFCPHWLTLNHYSGLFYHHSQTAEKLYYQTSIMKQVGMVGPKSTQTIIACWASLFASSIYLVAF